MDIPSARWVSPRPAVCKAPDCSCSQALRPPSPMPVAHSNMQSDCHRLAYVVGPFISTPRPPPKHLLQEHAFMTAVRPLLRHWLLIQAVPAPLRAVHAHRVGQGLQESRRGAKAFLCPGLLPRCDHRIGTQPCCHVRAKPMSSTDVWQDMQSMSGRCSNLVFYFYSVCFHKVKQLIK